MFASTCLISTVMNIIITEISAFCIGAKKLECSEGTKRSRRDGQEEEPNLSGMVGVERHMQEKSCQR